MVYLSTVLSAIIMTALFFAYLKREGYFVMDRGEAKPLPQQSIAIPPAKGAEEALPSSGAPADTSDSSEGAEEKKPVSYTIGRTGAVLLTGGFFLISLILCFLVYTYTVEKNPAPVPFLFVKMAVMHGIVGAAAVTDVCRRRIPNKLIIFGALVRLIVYVLEFILAGDTFLFTLKNDGIGFLIGFVFLFVVAVISRGGLGFGDVKLFGLLGLMAGSAGVFTTLFVTLLFSSVVSLILIAMKRKSFKSSLPMGPFIYAGFVVISCLGIF